MRTTTNARSNGRERLRCLVTTDRHEGDHVIADGRAAEILRVQRTGVGSIAYRVRFESGGTDERWVSALHVRDPQLA